MSWNEVWIGSDKQNTLTVNPHSLRVVNLEAFLKQIIERQLAPQGRGPVVWEHTTVMQIKLRARKSSQPHLQMKDLDVLKAKAFWYQFYTFNIDWAELFKACEWLVHSSPFDRRTMASPISDSTRMMTSREMAIPFQLVSPPISPRSCGKIRSIKMIIYMDIYIYKLNVFTVYGIMITFWP